ncbi:plasmid segregation protein ParM domain-containing protein [Klebsiella pneumoniae]|nr:plasmid segregation protein ParM domain-containing protein [Klebsiella pneumoniae]SVR97478.1 mediator of plasmid stability [Klebsiella pneumoniae]
MKIFCDDGSTNVKLAWFEGKTGFVNGMVASHLLCHSGTINRHSLNGALLS